MSSEQEREALFPALLALVRPVITFALRYGFSIHDLLRVAKRAYVEIAAEQISRDGGKANSSRISVLTGIHRNEIPNLLKQPELTESLPQSILGRVMVQWENDPHYSRKGQPKTLSCDGEGSEFWKLVKAISSNLGPATLMTEMVRAGLAARDGERLQLLRRGVNLSGETVKAYEYAGKDFQTLLDAVAENTSSPPHDGNLQIRTYFDNIYRRHVPKLRSWLIEEGKELHRRARNYLAELDADISPDPSDLKGSGVEVTLSAFSFIRLPNESNHPR